jgi:hypothetical protein
MTSKATISCSIGTTDPVSTLGMEIWLDDLPIYNNDHVSETQTLIYEIDDVEAEHTLKFVLKNKTAEQTQINEAGEIVKDSCLTIANFSFDDIDLGQLFFEHATYEHDFNGTQPKTTDAFYGVMGCNGTVTFKFATPIYLWLLEHM